MRFLAGPRSRVLPGEVRAARARVRDAGEWIEAARGARDAPGRLVSLWGSDRRDGAKAVFAAYAVPEGLCVVELALRGETPAYPEIAGLFPAAGRMQRALRDLMGIDAADAEDKRPWLAMRRLPLVARGSVSRYRAWIHAGIIEPTFPLSIVGRRYRARAASG